LDVRQQLDGTDFPATCPAGANCSCGTGHQVVDGKYLDTPDHKSHMAYPVRASVPRTRSGSDARVQDGPRRAGRPVQVPPVERARLPFHFDFFNAWDRRRSPP
jgi:hypothetical protein